MFCSVCYCGIGDVADNVPEIRLTLRYCLTNYDSVTLLWLSKSPLVYLRSCLDIAASLDL